jgi:hypothetical protein
MFGGLIVECRFIDVRREFRSGVDVDGVAE